MSWTKITKQASIESPDSAKDPDSLIISRIIFLKFPHLPLTSESVSFVIEADAEHYQRSLNLSPMALSPTAGGMDTHCVSECEVSNRSFYEKIMRAN